MVEDERDPKPLRELLDDDLGTALSEAHDSEPAEEQVQALERRVFGPEFGMRADKATRQAGGVRSTLPVRRKKAVARAQLGFVAVIAALLFGVAAKAIVDSLWKAEDKPSADPVAKSQAPSVEPRLQPRPMTSGREDEPAPAVAEEVVSDPPAQQEQGAAKLDSIPSPNNAAEDEAPGAPAPQPTEIELIGQARQELATNPAQALATLRQHRTTYPNGVLNEERMVLRVDAFIALGDKTRAAQALNSLEAAFPASTHIKRLGSRLDGSR